MARSTKSAWLDGPGDLREADVEDVPVPGQTVRVRGLPAAFSREAMAECFEQRQIGETQINVINAKKLAIFQFKHGCVEPEFTLEEVEQVATKYGPAFEKVVGAIDDLSGTDTKAVEEATARFQGSGNGADNEGEAGNSSPSAGSGGPPVPARVGA